MKTKQQTEIQEQKYAAKLAYHKAYYHNNKHKVSYQQWGNKSGTIQERTKYYKAVDPYSKEGQALQEESAKKYGRAWWMFNGISFNKKHWIRQFYVQGIRGPNKKIKK
mgnify:FL=1